MYNNSYNNTFFTKNKKFCLFIGFSNVHLISCYLHAIVFLAYTTQNLFTRTDFLIFTPFLSYSVIILRTVRPQGVHSPFLYKYIPFKQSTLSFNWLFISHFDGWVNNQEEIHIIYFLLLSASSIYILRIKFSIQLSMCFHFFSIFLIFACHTCY